jgi:hypothetical protein
MKEDRFVKHAANNIVSAGRDQPRPNDKTSDQLGHINNTTSADWNQISTPNVDRLVANECPTLARMAVARALIDAIPAPPPASQVDDDWYRCRKVEQDVAKHLQRLQNAKQSVVHPTPPHYNDDSYRVIATSILSPSEINVENDRRKRRIEHYVNLHLVSFFRGGAGKTKCSLLIEWSDMYKHTIADDLSTPIDMDEDPWAAQVLMNDAWRVCFIEEDLRARGWRVNIGRDPSTHWLEVVYIEMS